MKRRWLKQTSVHKRWTSSLSSSCTPRQLTLSSADCADYTPRWRQAGLPIKPSHLTLDPLLVQTGGMLLTSLRFWCHEGLTTAVVLSPTPLQEHHHALESVSAS